MNENYDLTQASSREEIRLRRVLTPGMHSALRNLILSLAFASVAYSQAPDTVYYNAQIITVSDRQPTAEALAIRGDRFLAVGTNSDILKLVGPATRKIDLGGKCVIPGIVESHVHPISAALSEIDGPVPVIGSIPALQKYIREQATKLPAGRVIFIPKVYSTRLLEHRYPTRYELDAAAPGRKIIADNGYASVLNSALLKEVGITRETPSPENGRIVKDEKGEPTGLVLGAPQLLGKLRATRPYTDADRLWALRKMLQTYNSVGITSIIDRGEGPEGFRAWQKLHDAGELTVRGYVTYLIKAAGKPRGCSPGDRGYPLRHRVRRPVVPCRFPEDDCGWRDPDRYCLPPRAVWGSHADLRLCSARLPGCPVCSPR